MDEKTAKPTSTLRESIIRIVLVLVLLMIGASIILPTGHRARPNARRSQCQSNLKQIMLGLRMYVQDYDERFPPANLAAKSQTSRKQEPVYYGWADAIQPYIKATRLYQCPEENNGPQSSTDPTQAQYTDYWFNARLSRVLDRGLPSPSQTIVLGDGNDGSDATNARYHLLAIPQKWRTDDQSPLYRHLDGANFAFADGHVKSVPARRWKSELDTNDRWTLRLNPKK